MSDTTTPDPIAYGPTGYRCGCSKDAHSNLTPCQPDEPTLTTYRIEFGPAWPVPPITVDFADRTAAARTVAAHAIPHLKPKLTEMGRPELADCFFQTDRDLTVGQFMWLSLAGEKAAQFCPARLTPTP